MPDAQFDLHPKYGSFEHLLAVFDRPYRLDLGCGFYKPPGFIGLDNGEGFAAQIADQDNAPDILIDLNTRPLPFADDTCCEVRASHFLEHSLLDHIFEQVHRVLVPGGRFDIIVPYANSAEGMYPGHLIFLTEKWFRENLNFNARFTIESETFVESEDYGELPDEVKALLPFDLARRFLFNVCREMRLVARVKK